MAKTTGELTIETIKNLIRYDIPLLAVGVSSIGKSFTIISLANRYRVRHKMLYIGSEKPENIEGLPKLQATGEKLEYFKPYWFPNEREITDIVKNGKLLFTKYINDYYTDSKNFKPTYSKLNTLLEAFSDIEWGQTETKKSVKLVDVLNSKLKSVTTLNETPFEIERTILTKQEIKEGVSSRDDVRDICAYICTILGYGNFWLVLDEIDKVEEFDIDKYAPLLHIVRERYLKGWNLVEINDTKGISIPALAKQSNYQAIVDIIDNAIANGQSLLDTRVIAIANKTNNVEDALFKRFVQLVIADVLILEKNKITSEMANLQSCLTEEELMGQELDPPPTKKLDSINLQWAYNFLIKMINKNDLEGNFLYTDALSAIAGIKAKKGTQTYKDEAKAAMRTTALYKILENNFEDEETQIKLIDCLASQMFSSAEGKQPSQEEENLKNARSHIAKLMDEYDNDENLVKGELIEILGGTYPKPIKGTIPQDTDADKLAAKQMKISLVSNWIGSAYAYIEATIYGSMGEVAPINLYKLLIPSIQHLVLEKLTLDGELPTDTKTTILLEAGEWWKKHQGVIQNLKVSGEEVKRVLYTANYPVFGVDYSLKDQAPKSANKKALFLLYSNNTMGSLLAHIANSKVTVDQIASDTGLYEYMKDYDKPYIVNTLIPAWKKSDATRKAAAEKLTTLFA